MNKIKFFYGLSGTFKTVSITAEPVYQCLNPPVVWSMIKLWKDLDSTIFSGKVEQNHLNFALLHLCCLENQLKNVRNKRAATVFSERGVSDPLFYYGDGYSEEWFGGVMEKERELCEGFEVEKVLLVQKDENFIRNVILKEPHRNAVFPSVSDYLEKQEKYVSFTEKYNAITEKIEIGDSRKYIESLGLTFKI